MADNMKHRRLQELDRSDFEIIDGEPDIRGWDVKSATGKKIGEVEDLIVDAQQKKVRYMVVDLDDNEMDLEDQKVLIPIGLAQLHDEDDDVILPNISADHLRSLPEYDRDHLDYEVENQICAALGRSKDTLSTTTQSSQTTSDEFYNHDYFNDDNLYKNRMHEAKPSSQQSEYENGLRLWERRSDGGVLPEDKGREDYELKDRNFREREIPEESRLEMVRNRRNNYEQRRNRNSEDNSHKRDKSVEGRIRREGLQSRDDF